MDSEQLKSEPQDWEFRSKPAWQRLIVMIGGVTVNFVLGILIYIFSLWYYGDSRLPVEKVKFGINAKEVGKEIGLRDGDLITGVNGIKAKYVDETKKPSIFLNDGNHYDVLRDNQTIPIALPKDIVNRISDKKNSIFDLRLPCIIDSTEKKSPADIAGLKKGDQIIAINDTATAYHHEVKEHLVYYANKSIKLTYVRNGDTLNCKAKLTKDGRLGFFPQDPNEKDYIDFTYTFGQSVPLGYSRAIESLSDNITGLKKLVSGKIDPRKSVQGPIGIATMFGGTWEWSRFWALTGLLSLILAFMNLLPIPALDGGHVVFLIIEMIIRRPLSDKFMQVMQVIGMVILLSLMVFAFGNDIFKLFNK